VELAGGLGIEKGDVVVIKPNAKNQSPPGYGIVTDTRVIESVVSLALDGGAKKVKIAEGSAYPTGAYDTMAAFEAIGITEIARRWGAELIDLNSYDSSDVDVPNGLVLDRVRVGRSVLEADVVINAPVLKTHLGTLISVCLKNMGVGCATREEKKRLHRLGIDKALVDVYSTVKPKFNLVDGIVALEGDGPNLPPGKPKPLGLLLAGKDGLAVDAVCAKIMGLDPRKVNHLELARRQGLGVLDLREIDIKGEALDDVVTEFELPSKFKTAT
jgi:uncharacterized protein (DUF362 family)